MATPTYVTDLVDIITDATATTGWTAIGGGAAGLNLETDYFIQGTACISKNAWGSGEKGMIYGFTGGITVPSNGAVMFWLTHADPNSMDTIANGGMKALIGSGTGAYRTWYMAGNDTVVYGGWITAAVDPSVSANSTTGSTTSTLQYFGGLANLTAGPTKGSPWGIDAIRYGRVTATCTNGESGAYASFGGNGTDGGLAAYDAGSTRRWGQFILRDGAYYMQGFISLGSGSTAVFFRDSNRAIFIRDTFKVTSAFNRIEILNASSDVQWTSISITALGTTSPGTFVVTAGTLTLTSCTFTDMGAFTFNSTSTSTSTTFRRCALITQTSATFTSCTFDDSTASATILANNPTLITSCTFNSDGSNHGMELNTSTGSTQYYDGSDVAATDPNSVWTNDANAFDGSTATSASTSTAGSTSTNYLMAEGTDAPASGSTITSVYARIYGSVASGDTLSATVYTDTLAEELGTATLTSTTAGWGSFTTAALTTPAGGWTWPKVQALETKIYKTGTAGTANVYRFEVAVFTGSYTFSGNTFNDYASTDGSTGNEMVYNNSGGPILINLSSGTDPSIRDGTSASTVVVSSVTLEVNGVTKGTRIRIEKVSDEAQLLEDSATTLDDTGITYKVTGSASGVVGASVRIVARKVGYLPFKTTTTVPSGGLVVTAIWLADPIADKVDTSES